MADFDKALNEWMRRQESISDRQIRAFKDGFNAAAAELLQAAINLRNAQRDYMNNRGNEELGRVVGVRARELDDVIEWVREAHGDA